MKYLALPGDKLLVPEAIARERLASRFLSPRHGAYRSADARNKNVQGWETSLGSADSDSLGDLPTLRRQSRDLLRNEALALGAIAKSETNVVGVGLSPQSRIDARYLGISDEEASEWQRDAERVFRAWASRATADAERRLSFGTMQSVVFRAMLESGDVFVLRRYLKRPGTPFGLACQIIEGDRVCNPLGVPDSARLRAGVELDQNGAPIAYHVADVHPGESSLGVLSGRKVRRVPAYDKNGDPLTLAIGRKARPGQTRGIPYLAPVIEPLKQLGRYTEAELSAAVISAFFAVFVTSQDPVTDVLTAGGSAGISWDGDPVEGIPEPARPSRIKLQSGMVTTLAPGEDIRSANASRPNSQFDPFVQALLRQIAMGLGLSYESFLGHFTSSYSASRAAIIETWRHYARERAYLIEAFCSPVYSWVISEAIASGRLEAPGFFDDPFKRDAWLRADWIGQGMPQIDPLKEAKAAKEWNSLGIWSKQDIAAAQGRDYETIRDQIARERREDPCPEEDKGLETPFNPRDEDEDEDEDSRGGYTTG